VVGGNRTSPDRFTAGKTGNNTFWTGNWVDFTADLCTVAKTISLDSVKNRTPTTHVYDYNKPPYKGLESWFKSLQRFRAHRAIRSIYLRSEVFL
jgi:hypothetical protein